MLDQGEKRAVLDHVRRWFPELAPGEGAGFDDLAFLDSARAREWYSRPAAGGRVFSSTGTSGRPKPVAWTQAEDGWYRGEKEELFRPWLDGCTRGFVSLAVGHNAGSAGAVLRALGIDVHDAGLTDLEAQCAAIREGAPEVLYCSPSILARLVGALERRGEAPTSVRRVITNGEVLLPSARERVQRFFGLVPSAVMDTYGSTEIGTIAYSCPECARYHFLDGVFPEAVPEGPVPGRTVPGGTSSGGTVLGRTVPRGTSSGGMVPEELVPDGTALGGTALRDGVTDRPDAVVLAVSSVKRTSFPIVRFVTYDVVQGLTRTRCGGRDRFSCTCILGRSDDVLNYGELFSPYELADLIGSRLPGARWFVFSPCNDLTVVIEGTGTAGFRDEVLRRYPLHERLVRLGLLEPPALHFVTDFDEFVVRAGLPAGGGGKDVRRVSRRRVETDWFPGGAAGRFRDGEVGR